MAGLLTFTVNSVVRGHHVYKSVWTPFLGEELVLEAEDGNEHDQHAVAVMKDATVVGHMPRYLLPVSWFFIKRGGTITCTITGHRKHGVGLEVPCDYTYKGSRRTIRKLKKVLDS